MSSWNSLPVELLVEIFRFMPLKDIANASQVCHWWKTVAEDPLIWRAAIAKDFKSRLEPQLQPMILFHGNGDDDDGEVDDLPRKDCRILDVGFGIRLVFDGPVPRDFTGGPLPGPMSKFSMWKKVYMLLFQLSNGDRCNCSKSWNCACGWVGLDPWQLSFATPGHSKIFLLLRLTTYRRMVELVREKRFADPELNHLMETADQYNASELAMRHISSQGNFVRYWRLKPAPIPVPGPHLVERLNFNSLCYQLEMKLLPEQETEKEWPAISISSAVQVDQLEMRCGDAGKVDGLKFHSWFNGFEVEYVYEERAVSFGTRYFFRNSLGARQKTFEIPACEARGELEQLCLSPESLRDQIIARYRVIKEQLGDATPNIEEGQGDAFHRSLYERLLGFLRFFRFLGQQAPPPSPPLDPSPPASEVPSETEEPMDYREAIEEKILMVSTHYHAIHEQLVRLLPASICQHLFDNHLGAGSSSS